MRIILLKDVGGVGKRDTIVDVSDGYALNFLIPRGVGEQATPIKIEALEKRKHESEINLSAQKEKLEGLAAKLKGKSILITAKANVKGHLYKSVTLEMIASEIERLYKIKTAAERITVKQAIRAVGTYDASLAVGEQKISFKIDVAAA